MNKTLHIFNPETDYALAMGNRNYSPPAAISDFRKKMALFPASYARKGDAVIIPSSSTPEETETSRFYKDVLDKELVLLPLEEAGEFISESEAEGDVLTVAPWGWNHTLLKSLTNAGIPSRLLKSAEEIDRIRTLSHRRTAILFQKNLSRLLPHIHINVAEEFTDVDETLAYCQRNPGAYLKAPWSSSGRGVVQSSSLTSDALPAWIKGCLKRQGSVMAEPGRERTTDFATEWICRGGKAAFLGLSLFNTSPQGRYLGNEALPQKEIGRIIASRSSLWDNRIVSAQEKTINLLIAPGYEGPVGIDMFSTIEGDINPCVEINLRMTMGLATLLSISGAGDIRSSK